MSAPDPSVTRKSGFLFPNLTYSTVYIAGVEIPYFWAVTPSSDLTASVNATWREGEVFQGVWRQRLLEGSYSIKAAGIFQQDPGYFANRDGRDAARIGGKDPERAPVPIAAPPRVAPRLRSELEGVPGSARPDRLGAALPEHGQSPRRPASDRETVSSLALGDPVASQYP